MQDGATPLHFASHNGHREVCTVLIEAKASVEAATKVIVCVMFKRESTFLLDYLILKFQIEYKKK